MTAPAPPRASRSVPVAVAWGLSSLAFASLGVAQFPLGLPWFWPALAFAVVAVGYLRGDAGLFGKTADGAIGTRARPWLWPYLGLMALAMGAARLSPEPAFHRVARGLYLGRRPRRGELPGDVTLLVDLTAELAAPLRSTVPQYVCAPTLDGGAVDAEALDALAARLAAHEGGAYVHCAFGHGRSAIVVAAALVLRGEAKTAAEGLALAKRARPMVRPSAVQRVALAAWDARRRA